jgi:hypothetical protein
MEPALVLLLSFRCVALLYVLIAIGQEPDKMDFILIETPAYPSITFRLPLAITWFQKIAAKIRK